MFLTFCWFWWFQVPLGTSIWRSLEVSRHHFEGFWGYWKVIGISLNSMVWLAGSRSEVTWSSVGKSLVPGALQLPNNQLAGSNMEYSKIAICKTWSLERISRLQSANLQILKGIEDFKIWIWKSYSSQPGGLQGGRRTYIFIYTPYNYVCIYVHVYGLCT